MNTPHRHIESALTEATKPNLSDDLLLVKIVADIHVGEHVEVDLEFPFKIASSKNYTEG